MKERLIDYFKNENTPKSYDEIALALNITSEEDQNELGQLLEQLEKEYIIRHNKKGCFARLSIFNLGVGTFNVVRENYGFVDIDDFAGIYVDKASFNGAFDKDIVLVKYDVDDFYSHDEKKYVGKITQIIKRSLVNVVGTLEKRHGYYYIDPINFKIDDRIRVDITTVDHVKLHDYVEVFIKRYFADQTCLAEIKRIIGPSFEKGVDIDAFVRAYEVEEDFPTDAQREAMNVPKTVDASLFPNRVDRRNECIITIDGDDSKDFDDAITVKKLENGNFMLGVYIADVSYYVSEGSALEQAALERGTSIYLPNKVIPMLPNALSNGICSLNENVDRLVLGCEMEINDLGEVVNHEIFEGIICSKHRMTYKNVNKMLEGDEILCNQYADILEMIQNAKECAEVLNTMRKRRGAFEFETIETKIILNEVGKVKEIVARNRGISESMIEEFMLICNECIALTMTYLEVPFIYRVHDNPSDEKLDKLKNVLNSFGSNIHFKNKKQIPSVLQKVLMDNDTTMDGISEEERTRRAVINTLLIRTMAKAKYQPQNIGHFGLQSKCYTHFTSPIRRYPDLLVHRLIKQFLLGEKTIESDETLIYYEKKVLTASDISSRKEKLAERLERDVIDYKICEYMESFVGKVFIGSISSILSFGMFVRLENSAEGLILFKNIRGNVIYNEKSMSAINYLTHEKYILGDIVKVKVDNVNSRLRQIDLKLLGKE